VLHRRLRSMASSPRRTLNAHVADRPLKPANFPLNISRTPTRTFS